MKVRVVTNQYVAVHGREPKGKMLWRYRIGATVVGFYGAYTQTKGQAMEKAWQQHVLSGAPNPAVLIVEVLA